MVQYLHFRILEFPLYIYIHIRGKFRSQTSDNMDRWKAEMGRVRKEKRRRKTIKKRKSPKKEDPGARKGRKVAKHFVFFNDLAPEGRKEGSLKRRLRSQRARWEMKNCTPLWREAHLQLRKLKSTSRSDHFWKLRCRKSARRCGAKHILKSKCTKHTSSGPLLEVEMSKKVHAVVARSTFRSKHVQSTRLYAPLLDVEASFCLAGARDCAPCQKWAKREDFVAFPKTMAGVGHLKRTCKDAFSVAGAVQEDMFIRDVRRWGRWFPERGCILEHQICSLLRWFCVRGAALRMTWHQLFLVGAVL